MAELVGPFEVAAFEDTWRYIVDRHEPLRTIYIEDGGEPVQFVVPSIDLTWPLVDVRRCSPEQIGEIAESVRLHQFDLSQDLPFQVCLCVTGESIAVLFLVVHHIASDGWSMKVLADEVSAAYNSIRSGSSPNLESLPVDYRDFSLWQRDLLGDPDDKASLSYEQLNYWRSALSELVEPINLPLDRERSAVRSTGVSSVSRKLDPDLDRSIDALASETSSSAYMITMAALAVTLHQYGARGSVAIGSPVSGRGDDGLSGLVGFFVNAVPVTFVLSGNPSIYDLLQQVRANVLGALAHQDVPFELIVEKLNPRRTNAFHPIFQVMVAYQNNASPRLNLDLVHATVSALPSGAAKFDLTINIDPPSDGANKSSNVEVEFATDVFDRDTIAAFCDSLVEALSAVVLSPNRRLSEFALTGSSRSLTGRAGPSSDSERVLSLWDMFDRQADLYPTRTALIFEGMKLSYASLRDRAELICELLFAKGISDETVVGICMSRGFDQIAAILSVLKLGGCYLALDPSQPTGRLEFFINDSAPAIIVADSATASVVEALDVEPLILGDDYPSRETERCRRVPANVFRGTACYVMYTSGSTGTPKAVVMRVGAVLDVLRWHNRNIPCESESIVSQFTSLNFDVSVQEIFSALLNGKSLAIPDELIRRNPSALARWLGEAGVSEFYAPNDILRAVATEATVQGLSFRSLRHVCQGGQKLRMGSAFTSVFGSSISVHNHYGCTETFFTAGIAVQDRTLGDCVGMAVDGASVFVLNEFLTPVPIGVEGEIYVGGSVLARGYLGRHASTAERFVACPWAEPGERMYRTGDTGKVGKDGSVYCTGRVDDQVKIRGVRVEPTETEAILQSDPRVSDAYVEARLSGSESIRLVAYVVKTVDTNLNLASVRQFASRWLDPHMLPTEMVLVGAIPRTASGKVDKSALSSIAAEKINVPRAAESDLEADLLRIYSSVLDVTRLESTDNFFDRGGNSLLIPQLMRSLNSELSIEVDPRMLLEYQSVRDLASAITALASRDQN